MKLTLKEFFVHEGEELEEHQDPTALKNIGASAWSDPTQKVDVHKFTSDDGVLGIEGVDDGDEMLEMGGPGSGRKKGSKNKPKQPKIIPGKQVDASELPDELPGSWFDDMETTMGGQREFDPSPLARSPDDDIDPDVDPAIFDPEFGKGATLPPYEPRQPKAASEPPEADEPVEDFPEFPDFDSEEEEDRLFDFRDLQTEDPRIAADIEAEIGPESLKGAEFTYRGKFTFMRTRDGKRWKHSEAAGWLPYDDGQSPTGEF